MGIETGELFRQEMSVCRDDPVHFISQWCYTCDPRDRRVWPLDPFPKQEAFVRWLQERERTQTDGLADKSRDMGVTWFCSAYALQGWLFRSAFSCGFGSRKLELVDTLGDLDSIFEKVRFMLYSLPAWMLPEGFRRVAHDKEGVLVNPANGSSIKGEGGNNIGRGGRSSIYFVDEAAYIERPESIERSLAENTNCRIDVSTPNGPGNPFATKRFSGKVSVFTLHWKDDPRKGEEWYAEKKRTKDPVTVAQEIDIDYSASVEGICIPAVWVRAAVELKLPMGAPIVAGLDIAEFGADRCVLIPRAGPFVLPPVDWGQCNTTETAHRAREIAQKQEAKTVWFDVGGVGAGIRGTWDSSEQRLPFDAVAVNAGESPTLTRWPDGKTSKERFVNLRAEMWWTLRARFERTWEHVNDLAVHPLEDLISIPNHPQLIAELSLPLYHRKDNGKVQVESKKAMRERGIKSPDFADALCLAFCPVVRREAMAAMLS